MNISQNENELVIRETPGCLWLFGLFFAVVGGVFVYGSLGGLADFGSQPWWTIALAFVMGSGAVAVGIWIIYRAPITKIFVDRIENFVLITRYGLFGKREDFYYFDEISYFCLAEETDDEGAPIWNFAMKLENDETVKITSLASHSEEYERSYVFQTNEFMRKQISPSQIIFEITDEPDAEMR